MKYCLLILVLFTAALAANATYQNKPIDLIGSWREVNRMASNGELMGYADTTYYDFMIGNEYTTQRKNSFMYRGTYKADGSTLDLGMRVYKISEWSHDRMLLSDDAGTYEFVRYDKSAAMAENNSASTSGARAYKEETSGSQVNAGAISGKWEVYKRTSSTTLSEIDYTRIIQKIDVTVVGGKTRGNVWAAKDAKDAPSWKITRFEDNTIYCTGKGDRKLQVLRCADGELIVREDVITYFFKQFE